MPSVHPHKKDKASHTDKPKNTIEVLEHELSGIEFQRSNQDPRQDNHSHGNKQHNAIKANQHNSNDAPLESYLELDKLVEEGRQARNDSERKENLKKQQEHHERLTKEIKTAYKDRNTTSKLKARNFRSQNLKEAATNAGSTAQAYIREANFLMQRLGSSIFNKNKIQHDIDGNFKSSNRFDIEANRLNATADKTAETPIEDDN